MATFTAACRASARAVVARASSRTLSTSVRCSAAQNFTMPALSPTMTEGNIAAWKVQEGATFSAGDVLLEIETDKATMDVEAQDDGILMKIMAGDGSKSVQVGSRIAVMAEAGDDIASLELPPDEQPKKAAEPKESSAPAPSESSKEELVEKRRDSSAVKSSESAGTYNHNYPLLPSVGTLVHQHSLSKEDVSKIKGTGPNGRLLKGDVLAYLGSIKTETPSANQSLFDKLSHLDLSNVKVAKPPAPPKAEPSREKTAAAEEIGQILEIQVPVSLSKVVEVQNKIQDTLGVFLPLSTFITRAAEFANDDLPLAARPPTVDELFDQVLGLDKLKAAKGSRGVYLPQISAIPPASLLASRAPTPKKRDVIDELISQPKKAHSVSGIPTVPGLSNSHNVFSLMVPKEEEERAQVFLERCKIILEQEPGRLVL